MKMAALTSVPTSPATATSAPRRGAAFPGCRKDANCHCEMCLASIRATRDLLPPSASALTKLSRRNLTGRNLADSLAPSEPPEGTKKRGSGARLRWLGLFVAVGLCFLAAVDSGAFAVLVRDFGPKLSPEVIGGFGSGAEFKVRVEGLQRGIEGVVGGGSGISDCSSMDTNWELIQGYSIFFHWRCVVYHSFAEEVSVWGSPVNTSGLFHTGFSRRSLTLISGSITEWVDVGIVSASRSSNSSSWTIEKWSTIALQLKADTWVVEYKRSALFEAPGLLPAAWEVLRTCAVRTARRLQQDPWSLSMVARYREHDYQSSEEKKIKHPT